MNQTFLNKTGTTQGVIYSIRPCFTTILVVGVATTAMREKRKNDKNKSCIRKNKSFLILHTNTLRDGMGYIHEVSL